jgi:imidazolonepropionase-like amidohydrolase
VDWIKIFVTEGMGGDPEKVQFTREQIVAAIREAGDVPVEAHAFGDDGVRLAVEAGVRSVEHGSLMSEATLDLMKRRGIYLVPTTAVISQTGDKPARQGFDDTVIQRNLANVPVKGRELLQHARRTGVKVVAGTDFSYTSDLPRGVSAEIANLVKLGFTPLEALQSATTVAAEMLNREKSIGQIAKGFEADVIAVRGNPLLDITVLNAPLLVMSNGRIALNSFSP